MFSIFSNIFVHSSDVQITIGVNFNAFIAVCDKTASPERKSRHKIKINLIKKAIMSSSKALVKSLTPRQKGNLDASAFVTTDTI